MRCLSKLLLSLVLFSGCTTEAIYPRHELAKQILRFAPDHPGLLVNRSNVAAPDGSKELVSVTYDLADSDVRRRLIDLKFICNVNGKVFHIDEDYPRLRHDKYEQKCFLFSCRPPVLVYSDFIDKNDVRLVDAAAYCYNMDQYDFELP